MAPDFYEMRIINDKNPGEEYNGLYKKYSLTYSAEFWVPNLYI